MFLTRVFSKQSIKQGYAACTNIDIIDKKVENYIYAELFFLVQRGQKTQR